MKSIICLIVIIGFALGCMLAQTNGDAQSSSPEFIDGSKNPEMIPDIAAYRLIFLNLRISAMTDKDSSARQDSKLHSMGLTNTDAATMKAILMRFSTQYDAWEVQAKAMSEKDNKALAISIVQGTRDLIVQRLSPGGAAKVDLYVQRAKARMIVRP